MKFRYSYNIDIVDDNNGKSIWKIPQNTLFDYVKDLWPLITDCYYNYYPFAIGHLHEAYDNYRLLTSDEIGTLPFIKLFVDNCSVYIHKTGKANFTQMFTGVTNIEKSIELIESGRPLKNRIAGLYIRKDLKLKSHF